MQVRYKLRKARGLVTSLRRTLSGVSWEEAVVKRREGRMGGPALFATMLPLVFVFIILFAKLIICDVSVGVLLVVYTTFAVYIYVCRKRG